MSEVVDIFGNGRLMEGRPELHVRLEKAVALLQGYQPDMAGYIVIGVGADGHWSCGWAVDPDAVLGRRMLAGLGVAAITEELLIDSRLRERGLAE